MPSRPSTHWPDASTTSVTATAPRTRSWPASPRVRKDIDTLDDRDDPVLIAIADAAARYRLPMGAFGELIDGCEMDVHGTHYETIDDLVAYCRRVAGTVGRLSLAVFGASETPGAVALADDLGVALQLTNILRDVVEDRSNGRVYLPADDARQLGCPPELTGSPETVAALVAFECARARDWFTQGLQLLPLLDRRSRACVGAMAGIYRRLLRADRGRPDGGNRAAGCRCRVARRPASRPRALAGMAV